VKEINDAKLYELRYLAKLLAVMGVRNNTGLEDLHCGVFPSSKAGDYSDVRVITPYGEIEWNRLSRISDEEMRALMLSIERALESALTAYESTSRNARKSMLKGIMKLRTYDKPDFR